MTFFRHRDHLLFSVQTLLTQIAASHNSQRRSETIPSQRELPVNGRGLGCLSVRDVDI